MQNDDNQPNRRITYQMLAERSGYSVSTVWRVFHEVNKPATLQTKIDVQQALRELQMGLDYKGQMEFLV